MKKRLLILPLTLSLLTAGTIKPKVMGARDSHRHYDRSSSRHHSSRPNDALSSTFEVTAQITLLVSSEASSEATSHGGGRRGNARIVHFLDENRIDITTDMAKGEGEHLTTLLQMMNLKQDPLTLSKIQTNFKQFIDLAPNDFLIKLKEITAHA